LTIVFFQSLLAKEMHMKGRRHRLQYKKKVDPALVVDLKPSLRQRKLAEERSKRAQDFWKWRHDDLKMSEEEKAFWDDAREEGHAGVNGSGHGPPVDAFRRFPNYRPGIGLPPPYPAMGGPPPRFGPPPPQALMSPFGPCRPTTDRDRHVMAKHAEIYPGEEELERIQRLVAIVEKGLKAVSDKMAAAEEQSAVKATRGDGDMVCESETEEQRRQRHRVLRGVMRVDALAKGLIVAGDTVFRLVVLCGIKPTRGLLAHIADGLRGEVAAQGAVGLTVKSCDESALISVTQAPTDMTADGVNRDGVGHSLTIKVSITSSQVRDEVDLNEDEKEETSPDERPLSRSACLEALAALRRAKWFQARAHHRQSCVVVIRVLREFCRRVVTWAPLDSYALELLVEKVLASAGPPLPPGEALRRVFEAVAGGLLLFPGRPGLHDPCEKEPSDAAETLTMQQREEITSSAQHALRLIAFRQIHRVLGMAEPLPPAGARSGGPGGRFARKRRRDEEADQEVTEDGPSADVDDGDILNEKKRPTADNESQPVASQPLVALQSEAIDNGHKSKE
jgi:zinc finger RNA-binding protein